MIQRIQSLYLFISFLTIGVMYFFPFAGFVDNNDIVYQLRFAGLIKTGGQAVLVKQQYLVPILLLMVEFITVFTILQYRKRSRQIGLSLLLLLMLFILNGAIYYSSINTVKGMDIKTMSFYLPVVLPFVGMILVYLAMRAIRKDDELVKSSDRLR